MMRVFRGKRGPEVSICIPAWESRPFIDKTLDLALAQTHANIKVLVSVDLCDDGTAEACLDRATTDSRLQVFVQPKRLGWARNVNFLLRQVESPFFCIYFHDDEISPHYVQRLLEALNHEPAAMSAHCDMGHFGGSERADSGYAYISTTEERLATWFVNPNPGSPARSLIRSELLADGLQMPDDSLRGYWANWPFLMKLLAAGPALHVPETLYSRWDKRPGGLTDGWTQLSDAERIAGYASTTGQMMSIVEDAARTPDELRRLTFCLYVRQMAVIRHESIWGIQTPFTAADIHPAFGQLTTIPDLTALGPDITGWALALHASLPAEHQLATVS